MFDSEKLQSENLTAKFPEMNSYTTKEIKGIRFNYNR